MLRKVLFCSPILFLAFGLLSATAFAQTDANNLTTTTAKHSRVRQDARKGTPGPADQFKVHPNYFGLYAGSGFKLLYTFKGGTTDGANPDAQVVQDASGNLYTTTYSGGAYNPWGTVYKLSTSGTGSVLYSFPSTGNGKRSNGSLVLDSSGYLWGTTNVGAPGCTNTTTCNAAGGIAFKLDASNNESTVTTFSTPPTSNPSHPMGGFVQDAAGNFYGVTASGGAYSQGTVYKMDQSGNVTPLYSFTGGNDGSAPSAQTLAMDASGNLYGISNGGSNGYGVAFKVTNPATSPSFSVIYSFGGPPAFSGYYSASVVGLTIGPDGNLYGASNQGGDCGGTYDGNGPNSGCGDVYRLTPGGVETQLYDFSDSDAGGYNPMGPVVVDSAGIVYGTTTNGGASGVGVLYKITSAGHETVLRAFSSGTDGNTANGVILAPDGNLYGTSNGGGAKSFGTIWGYGLAAATQTLTVSVVEGTGASGDTVTSSPSGISCPGTCSYSFNQGTNVTLTANTATGDSFTGTGDGWSGACSGNATQCTVTMSAVESVTATFSYVPTQAPTTTVVNCTPNPSTYGQSVTCTATVTGTQGTPTGSVTFYNNGTGLPSGAVAMSGGSASYPTSTLPVGGNSITAIYGSDSKNQSSTSSVFIQTVTTIPTNPSCSYAAPITFGTGIPAANCTVTPNVPGTYTYNPNLGTVLNASAPPYSIGITFTPTDTTHYGIGTTTALLTINKATPVITWATLNPITYGIALSGTQLSPYASSPLGAVTGTYGFTAQLTSGGSVLPTSAGMVLGAGIWTLTASFTPNDTSNYNTGATGSTTLTINQAMPTITWVPPTSSITYGTNLSAVLDATVNPAIAGTWGYTVTGTPVTASTVLTAGSYTLVANFTPTDTVDYTTPAPVSVPLTINQATPVITWPAPTPITYGTNLSGVLDATDTLPGPGYLTRSKARAKPHVRRNAGDGTFVYTLTTVNGTPVDGTTVLNASSTPYTLWVTFTPNDTTDYTTATASVPLTVNQATPVITWPTPLPITYGTNLSAILDAKDSLSSAVRSQARANFRVKSNDDGTFVYTLADGTPLSATTVLNASSTPYTLVATFTPTDMTDYTTATASVTLTVNQATPVITWATPAPIIYGTALSGTQLNATANVAGSFVYSPAAGTVLGAGSQTLTATFTPADTTDYTTPVPATVTLTVTKATPTITWPTPAPVPVGTVLSATQLDATASVAGTFVYSPPAGTAMNTAGPQTLSVTFTPNDTSDYTTVTNSVTLQVLAKKLVAPKVSFTAPTKAPYNSTFTVTAADASEPSNAATITANGVCTISGTAVTMTASTGVCTLTATWAGDDLYKAATVTKNVAAELATPVITWETPAAIAYGTPLSATQQDATANVSGTFTYTQAVGTVLAVGTHTLSVTFTPGDTTNYTTAKATAKLVVNQATTTTTITSAAALTSKKPLAVTVNFTVAGQNNGKVTGPVTVTDSNTGLSCSGSLSASGAGHCTITFSSTGTASLTAVYAGNANNSGSTSAAFSYPPNQ